MKMTIVQFQERVLRELAEIKKDIAVAIIRIDALERKQCAFEDKAEQTGRHELLKLQDEVSNRKMEWISWSGKALLLIIGSILATIVPRFF